MGEGWGLVAHSLSGRLLLLTILYVMLTQVLIFVPSIGRYYRNELGARVDAAEIAILPFTEPANGLSDALRAQLLTRAGAIAVMLPRADQREIFLSNEMPSKIDVRVDLRNENPFTDMIEGMDCLLNGGMRTLQITAPTKIVGAQSVQAIVNEKPIHSQLKSYAWGILLLAVLISLATGVLVFISLYLVLVRPMRHITRAMVRFRDNPEDASRIVTASSRPDEIGIAERELASMQRDIYGSLQQRSRLAALGTAVAKIQHDLRNILSSAQLASDQLAKSADPSVQRLAPRLVSSIDHAVALATNTLRYGRADEHPPQRRSIRLKPIVEEAREAALEGRYAVQLDDTVDDTFEIDADAAQLFRILLNILRNAGEALGEKGGTISVSAARVEAEAIIDISDNGPGIPSAVRERLFQPFAGSARAGGSGLGLAIARELARAHGGDVVLVRSDANGTQFRVTIPDRGTA
ncbi:MAG TPA: HAMP domain-containing sensor histidine kinase [Rhizomicrobium sp.]|nr:HAMP domain-containing sensor histidine kinase [Rhizomicrobium sp.]